ncbi:MAG: O-acetylhomoserine aminocarboxypropyltransferase/cysteine synthase [Paludibacteraceae bacterium]|nr:O-acetylhomoserine aminocarboxypropyltransferase/cysteine synthase [Paludibacteraceae bacterium]MBR6104896.1 O-acetylhomoserine aminocarboxypropyltransferase/cysteine synthase [Paludibacteraceae bacterium]
MAEKKTTLIQVPFDKPDAYHALNMPLYHSVAFEFDSAEEMELAFTGRSAGHAYSRITNPTVQYFEKRVQALTRALSVTAMNTGMSAISNALITVSKAGANIVTSKHLFSNTMAFLFDVLAPFGVEIRTCDLTNPDVVRQHIDENTCAIFLEIITNPQLEVADLGKLGVIGKEAGVPLIADSTIVPFTHYPARELGVNIEVLSSTKYLAGGGTSLGGLIIDYGNFNWKQSKTLGEFAQQYKAFAFTKKLRSEVHSNLGCYMTPHAAYMQTLGLETLGLRYKTQAENTLVLAKKLSITPGIVSVNYPGLPGHPFHEVAKQQFGELTGAVLTFSLENRQACFSFLNKLKLVRRATNLFENKSLAIHPASTIFGNFKSEQLEQMNIDERAIRLSVGLEDVEDIYQDIVQALQ